MLQQCNVINLHTLANCRVWNYSPVETPLTQEFSDFRILTAHFLVTLTIPPIRCAILCQVKWRHCTSCKAEFCSFRGLVTRTVRN